VSADVIATGIIVLDASALLELLLGTAVGSRVDQVVRRAAVIVGPAHIDAEVLSALGRLERSKQISAGVVDDCLDDLADMPMTRVPLPALLGNAWALRANFALRDALYVVVAQRTGAKLVTVDLRLHRALDQLLPGLVHKPLE
jgi:predicted nucleic acid-binding protein